MKDAFFFFLAVLGNVLRVYIAALLVTHARQPGLAWPYRLLDALLAAFILWDVVKVLSRLIQAKS